MATTNLQPGRTNPPLKADMDTDELITDGAHLLGMPKKDLVGEAVRAYLEDCREEMRQAMLEKLRKLDGATTSSVSHLTGIPAEDIERLSGVGGDT